MASEVRRLTKALAFAAEAHRNHRRKGASQETYINHLIEVVDLVASVEGGDMDVLIAALLHDVLEDTRTGYDELAAAFGERVARNVQENSDDMTLPKPERRRVRLAGISKKSREARLVKFADIISNLRAIAVSPPAGWSNDRRLGYLDSCRNLVDAETPLASASNSSSGTSTGVSGLGSTPAPAGSVQPASFQALESLRGIKVGDVDLGAQLASAVTDMRSSLSTIVDTTSAQAAVAPLTSSANAFAKLTKLLDQLSPEVRKTVVSKIAATRPDS